MTAPVGRPSFPSIHGAKLSVRILSRHPVALLLAGVTLASAAWPVPPLVDAVAGGAAGGDVGLVRPLGYTLLAPLSNTLDALTFLSLERAKALVLTWLVVAAAVGALRSGSWRRRLLRGLTWPLAVVALAAAAVLLPRPVPRLAARDPSMAILDYHVHTVASHDGRPGWTLARIARWHARQGFTASYITDHNRVFGGTTETEIPLLPGVEWSLHQLHLVAIGPVQTIDRAPYSADLDGLLGVFAAIHRQGAMSIASIPEYWRYHRENLERFAIAGADGFEIVNCAPKAIGLPPGARGDVIRLAQRYDLLLTGASDSHGWGMVTCVWNLTLPGERRVRANRVLARPLALAQGRLAAWHAGVSQPWEMARSLTWPERVSWLCWITLITIYRVPRRRNGQRGGIGVLARTLRRKRRPDS